MLRQKLGYTLIDKEADLMHLVPGDRILVAINQGLLPERMVYASEQLEGVGLLTQCDFIQVPDGYKGEGPEEFKIWSLNPRSLLFPGEYMQMQQPVTMLKEGDPNKRSRKVQRGTPEYDHAKSLVDMLE
jgi:hypothetical protein